MSRIGGTRTDPLVTFSVSIKESVVRELDELVAKRTQETGISISRSWIVRDLVRDALERIGKKGRRGRA